jgi:TonB family protein
MRPAWQQTSLNAARAALLVAAAGLALGADAPPPGPRHAAASLPPPARGCEPAELRARLAAPDSADIARACGNIASPWAYRGPLGRENSMRSYGPHGADRLRARALAAYLLRSATIDTASKVPSTRVPCEPAQGKPVYLVAFHGHGKDTFALLRFDLGAVLFFDAEEPLGMAMMGVDGDSLWAAVGEVLDNDPLLRTERPRPPPFATADSLSGGPRPGVELPVAIKKVHANYSYVALGMKLTGVVMVQALVGEDGTVKDALVVSGHPVFRDDALEAVWQWQFKPASRDGRPIAVWVEIPVWFLMP